MDKWFPELKTAVLNAQKSLEECKYVGGLSIYSAIEPNSSNSKKMNSTSNSDQNPSQDSTAYVYYSFGLTIAILMVLAFITLTLWYCGRRNSHNDTESGQGSSSRTTRNFHLRTIMVGESSSRRQVGVDEATLKSYPVLLYSEAKLAAAAGGDTYTATCSVCLGDYKDTEWLRLLPDCCHFFHQKCIDLWLRMNPSCPLCRTSPLPSPVSTPLAEVAALARTRS